MKKIIIALFAGLILIGCNKTTNSDVLVCSFSESDNQGSVNTTMTMTAKDDKLEKVHFSSKIENKESDDSLKTMAENMEKQLKLAGVVDAKVTTTDNRILNISFTATEENGEVLSLIGYANVFGGFESLEIEKFSAEEDGMSCKMK